MEKTCSKCKQQKPTSAFSADSKRKDGLQLHCKECNAAYYASNRRRICERVSAHRKAHIDSVLAYGDKYRATHQPEIATYRETHHAQKKEWYQSNKSRYRAYNHKRRARKYNAGGTHTANDVARQLKIQEGKCWWCGQYCADKYEEDHLIPLSRGGHDGAGNIVISCKPCNRTKHKRLPEEWIGRLF